MRISEPPSTSLQRGRLVIGERDRLAGAVWVVLVGQGELSAAVAEVEDREPTAFVGDDVMADTDPGQFGALDVGGHAYIIAPGVPEGTGNRAVRDPCAAVA